jgi:uncharacterized protein YyaL (SSP411 family)
MVRSDGAFAASMDADDPGGEGAAYTWTPEELAAALGPARGAAVAPALGITPYGNTDFGRSTLRLLGDPSVLSSVRAPLLKVRLARPQPLRDDKATASWNAMAAGALGRFGLQFGDPDLVAAGARALGSFLPLEARVLGSSVAAPVLEDLAQVGLAALELQAATRDGTWLQVASTQAHEILGSFVKGGRLVHAHAGREDLFLARHPWRDDAAPSATGAALELLVRLCTLGDATLDAEAIQALVDRELAAASLVEAPSLVSVALLGGARTVVVGGPAGDAKTQALLGVATRLGGPSTTVVWLPDDAPGRAGFSTFEGKLPGGPQAWVCEGQRCMLPTASPDQLGASLAPPAWGSCST